MKAIIPVILFLATLLLSIPSCKHQPDPIKPEDPKDTNSTNNGIPCDQDTVYFTEIQAMINSNCMHAGCHNSQDKQDGVDLSSYSSILATADVRPGSPDNSDIYEVLIRTGGDAMPPYPYPSLSQEQIDMVKTWIEQGAKNNRCDGCDTTNVTFSGQVSSLMATSCIACHNDNLAQASINLSTYSGVKAIVDDDRLLRSVKHDTGVVSMPYLLPALDACKIRIIELWINDGAQDN